MPQAYKELPELELRELLEHKVLEDLKDQPELRAALVIPDYKALRAQLDLREQLVSKDLSAPLVYREVPDLPAPKVRLVAWAPREQLAILAYREQLVLWALREPPGRRVVSVHKVLSELVSISSAV